MSNRIHASGEYMQEEYVAGEAGIYPGMLIQLKADGKVYRHFTENGRNEKMFAAEDALQGRTISTVYAVDSIVTCIIPRLGSQVNALLYDGEDVNIGDWLVSKGNGCLKKQVDDSAGIDVFTTGVVLAALDLSASAGGHNDLVKIRVGCH